MKGQITATIVLMLSVAAGVSAGEDSGKAMSQEAEIEQGRAMVRAGREEVIRSELHLTDDESSRFWPVYLTYRHETDAVQDRYAAMINDYVRRYDDADLSNEYADELIDTYFGIKRELFAVQEKFLPQFRAVLPSLKVARLFQLENKINAEIDAQLAMVIPLVDPS